MEKIFWQRSKQRLKKLFEILRSYDFSMGGIIRTSGAYPEIWLNVLNSTSFKWSFKTLVKYFYKGQQIHLQFYRDVLNKISRPDVRKKRTLISHEQKHNFPAIFNKKKQSWNVCFVVHSCFALEIYIILKV